LGEQTQEQQFWRPEVHLPEPRMEGRVRLQPTEGDPMTQQKSGYGQNYARDTAETAKDGFREMVDTTTGKVKEAAGNAQEMAGKIADQAREYGEQAQEAAKQARPFVEKSLRQQPMATLAGAAVLGFVLGALWKR
jgi:ElaB/YqjD/DUF883 family membrane-anchored ribosome-binding protein